MSEQLIQTYVFHPGGKSFFVSTADRESSAAFAYGSKYAETMVWEWDPKTRERGAVVHSDSGPEGTIGRHQQICVELFESGVIVDPNA